MDKLKYVVLLGVLVSNIMSTHDVNLSMYIYLANHLTPQECLKLTTYLYAEGLESNAVEELGQYLPSDEPCLSLLMTWNNGVGNDKNFLDVADGLKKIGRQTLADWLSETVFTKFSIELENSFLRDTATRIEHAVATTTIRSRARNVSSNFKTADSCPSTNNILFLLFDTFSMYVVLMTIVTSVLYALILIIHAVKKTKNLLGVKRPEYKVLEIGELPHDLAPEDNILDTFF